MSIDRPGLDPFFAPRRIALVGASERGMYPAGILRNLLDYGYSGELYPVNPNRETVFGLRCYADVTQLPHRPDLVILTVPRETVLPVLRQCIAIKAPAALVITAGFAESDERGKSLQAELVGLLRGQPMRVIGPNSAGLADIPGRLIATRLPAEPRPGPVSFASQSGALMMALYGLFADRCIGMNRLISVGNQVDVTLAEALDYLVDDPNTEVIGAFVEGARDAPTFVKAWRRALIAGKPIVLIKSGRTASGRRAAATHTAALTGSSRVFEAACEQFGVILVDDIRAMMDITQVMAAFGRRLSGRGHVALVTQSGGLGSLTADLVEASALHAPPLSRRLIARLRDLSHIPQYGQLGNPTDVRGPSVIGSATTETLMPFLEDPDTDVVVLLLAKSAVREQDAATAQAIVDAARNAGKPLCVVWVGQRYPAEPPDWPLGHRILSEAGIPLFDQPSDCVRALASAVSYWRYREAWLADPEVCDV